MQRNYCPIQVARLSSARTETFPARARQQSATFRGRNRYNFQPQLDFRLAATNEHCAAHHPQRARLECGKLIV